MNQNEAAEVADALGDGVWSYWMRAYENGEEVYRSEPRSWSPTTRAGRVYDGTDDEGTVQLVISEVAYGPDTVVEITNIEIRLIIADTRWRRVTRYRREA